MRLISFIISILPLLLVTVEIAANLVTLKPSTIRTELRVGKSLRPQDEQQISITGTNGDSVNIIVKKRDPKQASTLIPNAAIAYNTQLPLQVTDTNNLETLTSSSSNTWNRNPTFRTYSTMLHNNQTMSQSNAENLNEMNARHELNKDDQLIESFIKHISRINRMNTAREYHPQLLTINQLRVDVPEPVVVSSIPVNFDKNSDRMSKKVKQGRSKQLMKIDSDGIPVIEGIRMPDDEEDKVKTWRNGRVINGIFIPYEKGYVPKKAIQLDSDFGQLLYVRSFDNESQRNESNDDIGSGRSFGPFTKFDNFKSKLTGPFTVDDNRKLRSSVRVANDNDSKKPSLGPFSIKDNSRMANSKLIDYIKTINDKEYRRRDFFLPEARHRNIDNDDEIHEAAQPKIQRRMLENIGEPVYAPSRYYSNKQKKAVEQRSPVVE